MTHLEHLVEVAVLHYEVEQGQIIGIEGHGHTEPTAEVYPDPESEAAK